MFLMWLTRKLTNFYEDSIKEYIPFLTRLYKLWVALSFIFVFVDVLFPYNELDVIGNRFLHDILVPLGIWTAIIPFCIYLGWKLMSWIKDQQNDYSYFKESGGKIKNEEKRKRTQIEQIDEEDEIEEKEYDPLRENFKRGYQDAFTRATKSIQRVDLPNPPATKLEQDSWDTYEGNVVRENNIKISGYTSLLLDDGASNRDAAYVNGMILITSGNAAGQIRFIVAYNGKTHEAYIDEPWIDPPDEESNYVIINDTQQYRMSDLKSEETIANGQVRRARPKSVELDGKASNTDSFYNGCLITILSGTGAGQSRFVIGYNGDTKVATVDKEWDKIPDDSSVYSLILSQAYWRNELPVINDAVLDETTSVVKGDIAEDQVVNVTGIEVSPDFGDHKPKNILTDDGEIPDGDDGQPMTLDELLKSQNRYKD